MPQSVFSGNRLDAAALYWRGRTQGMGWYGGGSAALESYIVYQSALADVDSGENGEM